VAKRPDTAKQTLATGSIPATERALELETRGLEARSESERTTQKEVQTRVNVVQVAGPRGPTLRSTISVASLRYASLTRRSAPGRESFADKFAERNASLMNEVFNEWRTDTATRHGWWRPWNDQHQQRRRHGEQRAVNARQDRGEEPSQKRAKTATDTKTE